MTTRYLGIDVGAETIKVVELRDLDGRLEVSGRHLVEHGKKPDTTLRALLSEVDWESVTAVATTGRMSRMLQLHRVPTKAALARGFLFSFPELDAATVVSIGSHGFSVLELRENGHQVYRENSRCAQGTGNFLRQLIERFDLSMQDASTLSASVENPAVLSGRCPVILKTDMTHLANKGEDRGRILAGLYDAVCENVQALLRPQLAPKHVLLTGGAARAPRVRQNFKQFLTSRHMDLVDGDVEESLLLEALGAALVAADELPAMVSLEDVFANDHKPFFERVGALRDALPMVNRMPARSFPELVRGRDVVLGYDIGSTGSKAVAVDSKSREPVWDAYVDTLGNPVAAAQNLTAFFLEGPGTDFTVQAVGATGSGREIVGSLMAGCFGPDRVFVLNEIAAHAEGALHYDSEVDTIFEIGGQDAKYIRLDSGRICEAAMNEACSAGTGSFIAEQGGSFEGVDDVVEMGAVALDADCGIALGQHCSVFMAEVIDEAVSAGEQQAPIIAGLYGSIIQNYLNRVKGSRSVGKRIFCQGMPFTSDALAAAVASQTECTVVVPPNPGTIGALGIGLLTVKELDVNEAAALDMSLFLGAKIDRKDTFMCKSTTGCGGPGNRCRIDRMRITVAGDRRRFLWGGNCSLYDAGTRGKKLPDLTPDPFRERAELVQNIIEEVAGDSDRPVVAMTDEFALKGLMPFFATFVRGLGFGVQIVTKADQKALKRGIEEANVPFCAPMQLYQGAISAMLADEDLGASYILEPRVRDLPRNRDERHATTCPIVQGSPDVIRKLRPPGSGPKLVITEVDMDGDNLMGSGFRRCARRLASELGAESRWLPAYEHAVATQKRFEADLVDIGRRALTFASEQGVTPVVVLGRAYTIHNTVLNSNVPNILRGQGALAIPVDCYPISDNTPIFDDLYWGYSQQNLRAAHQIRRTDGVYAVFCSNYSCGPDSFNLQFFSYVMENKPAAIIETDGHTGDAGTKTRIEAFLYCVETDRRLTDETRLEQRVNDFKAIETDKSSWSHTKARQDLLLLPRMGNSAPEILAELLAAEGYRVECLPLPTHSSFRLGQRHTSGKECIPMTITLGSLLERLEAETDPGERFAFFMPTADGPCRFGVYNLLHKIVVEHTGWKDRVRVVSPTDKNYFAGLSPDFRIRSFVGIGAADMLLCALHDVRPLEKEKGAADKLFRRYYGELKRLMRETQARSVVGSLSQLGNGMFGARSLLERAADEFRDVKDFGRDVPTVAMVGEIYVRLDPFANNFLIEQLESRGLRVRLAPFVEWLEYTSQNRIQRRREGRHVASDNPLRSRITHFLEKGVLNRLYGLMAGTLEWPHRTTVENSLSAAAPYIDRKLMGEAVLTLGGPVHEYDCGHIDGAVSVGPHECMPNKIAEAQFAHVGDEKGLISLTLPLTGDPVDPEILDRFAFEVKQHHSVS